MSIQFTWNRESGPTWYFVNTAAAAGLPPHRGEHYYCGEYACDRTEGLMTIASGKIAAPAF